MEVEVNLFEVFLVLMLIGAVLGWLATARSRSLRRMILGALVGAIALPLIAAVVAFALMLLFPLLVIMTALVIAALIVYVSRTV